MSSSFRKKSSQFFVTAFIGFIIISFMFTGYETMRGTPDTIATVNGENIRIREYQNEYNRQLEFYRQFSGDDLTAQQIQQFGIKDNTINSLVTGKLMAQLATRLGAYPSDKEVSQEIKELPYFQTNKRFDIERYKQLLTANGLTPGDFESDIQENITRQKSQVFFNAFPISDTYFKEVQQFKAQRLNSNIVQISKENMRKNLPVSQKEIDDFLADETNLQRVQSTFQERKPTLDRPEQVKARHILYRTEGEDIEAVQNRLLELKDKLTPRNFADLARENTEDPSGKENGGDLGWFGGDGQMVPEFEEAAMSMKKGEISEPIQTDFGLHILYVEDRRDEKIATFDEYKNQIVTELLQRNKTDELDQLVEEVKSKVEQALKNNNLAAVERLQEQYNFSFDRDSEVNLFDGNLGNITIPQKEVPGLFENDFTSIENQNEWFLISSTELEKPSDEEMEESITKLEDELTQLLSRKLQDEIVKELQDQASINVHSNRIR